ncbi:hypothetical protein [Kitasatospora sp. NPDC005856]|uniref:hypothetical protein n=1 Tax=Kitasatospora sp. NPDC005856 TaxID=3154566 RepID=UPI0033C1EBC1
MKRIARSLAVAATAGSLTLLAAPASLAAASSTTTTPCATYTASNSYGYGQLSVCPLGGTNYRISGYISTNMPDGGIFGPNCAGWYLRSGSTYLGLGTTVCAQPNVATSTRNFDYSTTLSATPDSAGIQQVDL